MPPIWPVSPGCTTATLLPTQDVAQLGYKIMICGSTIWLVYQQVHQAFQELKSQGRVDPERYGTRMDVANLLGLEQIYQLERKYGVSQLPVA